MSESNYITLKEIAAANEISVETVKRRERALGLHRCRCRVSDRPIRFKRREAAAALTRNGWEVPP